MKNSLLHHAPSYLATVAALLTLVFAMTTPLTPFMAFIGIPLLLLSIAATGLLAQQRLGRCREAGSAKAARRAPENPRGIRHPLQHTSGSGTENRCHSQQATHSEISHEQYRSAA